MRIPVWSVAATGSLAVQGLCAAVVSRLPPSIPGPVEHFCECVVPFPVRRGLSVLPHGSSRNFLPPEPGAARCEAASPPDEHAPLSLEEAPGPWRLPAQDVVACAAFDAAGGVEAAWIIKGSGETDSDRRALKTLRATRFQPARLDGRAVAAQHIVLVGRADWGGIVF
jgi:hypothetical protein